MFFVLILSFASIYFFVPLLLGWFLVSISYARWNFQKVFGWICLTLGAWGAVSGVPYWFARAKYGIESELYFSQRCKQEIEELPATRLKARGLLVVGSNVGSHLGGFQLDSLTRPSTGGFEVIQIARNVNGVVEYNERTTRPGSAPGRWDMTWEKLDQPTLPYRLDFTTVTSETDYRYRISGVEASVVDVATGQPIAKHRTFVQSREPSRGTDPPRQCPNTAKKGSCLSDSDCSAMHIAFVTRALQPVLTQPASAYFHLYPDQQQDLISNCFAIHVEPSVQLEDILWWWDGSKGWEDLHLSVRGSLGGLKCDRFFWSAGHREDLRFGDGRSFKTSNLARNFRKFPPGQPHSLK